MKIASYLRDGHASFGIVTNGGLATVSDRLPGAGSLRDRLTPEGLAEIAAAGQGQPADCSIRDVRWLPVVPDPRKFVGIGINYRDHAEETGRAIVETPSIFLRNLTSLIGHDEPMVRPSISGNFDFEGELAIVVGRGGRYITEGDAPAHVAGYTCFVDGSVRDYQKHSVTAGKNFPHTGPFGPWIVTSDEAPDPSAMTLTTRLNGEVMQESGIEMMILSVARLIAYVSQIMPLETGDVIATGTPAGVGHRRDPQLWMKPGDRLEVEISGLGTLRTRVVDE